MIQKLTYAQALKAFKNQDHNVFCFKWNPTGSKGFGTLLSSVRDLYKQQPQPMKLNGQTYNGFIIKSGHHVIKLLINGYNVVMINISQEVANQSKGQGSLL